MSKPEHWLDSNDPTRVQRGMFGSMTYWVVGLLVLSSLVGIAVWLFGVATSDLKGRGDAAQIKNSGINRIAAQERFEERYQDILATDRKIDVAKTALNADPKNQTLVTNYTGVVQYCIDIVGKYNADALKYTSEAFRTADLPAQIDNHNPATDCKENTK